MTAEQQREMLVMQLLAARAQIDATLSVLGVHLETGGDIEECPHPKDKRVNHGVLGGPEDWECTACGFHYDASKVED